LDLLQSKEKLDLTANSSEFSERNYFRSADTSGDMIHAYFTFEKLRGESPHGRVSLSWEDVEAAIAALANKGHPSARVLQGAEKFAAAICEIAKNSN
jgi:hypothetical protein